MGRVKVSRTSIIIFAGDTEIECVCLFVCVSVSVFFLPKSRERSTEK